MNSERDESCFESCARDIVKEILDLDLIDVRFALDEHKVRWHRTAYDILFLFPWEYKPSLSTDCLLKIVETICRKIKGEDVYLPPSVILELRDKTDFIGVCYDEHGNWIGEKNEN